jgi:HPt (histidine-containing phosphotransfer) domain-containing protein
MEQAAKVAHSLKGSSALAGATRIQNAAMEAEQAAMDCDREYLGKVIEIIEECFKKYKSAVATCI